MNRPPMNLVFILSIYRHNSTRPKKMTTKYCKVTEILNRREKVDATDRSCSEEPVFTVIEANHKGIWRS